MTHWLPYLLQRKRKKMAHTSKKMTLSPSRSLLVKIGMIAILVIGGSAAFLTSGSHQVAHAATNWTQIWGDEFNGAAGSGLDTSNWEYDTGPGSNFGTGEIETMTNSTSNVYQDGNGHLVIQANRDGNGNWTSGRFESVRSDFQPPAGGIMAFESSIFLPNLTGAAAQGYWPAFWSLGSTFRTGTSWPTSGEIDVMESVNGTNVDHGTLHCGNLTTNPCGEYAGISGSTSPSSGGALQGNFHTYRMELDYSTNPQQIRWYLDGNLFFTVNSNQVDATTWANATNHGFFIIYDLAMGGNWPGNPTSATASGGTMLIDYVHVYTSSPSSSSSPTVGSGWTQCASENQNCSFSGSAAVAYGANGQFAYGNFTNGVSCSNGVFGDPDYGVGKSCFVSTSFVSPAPGVWTQCANENGTCSFSGTMNVAYGNSGHYTYGTYTNSVSCSNSVFPDPDYGVFKACFYSAANSSNTGNSDSVSGYGYQYGVSAPNSSTATIGFTPSGWTASYVIVHYTVSGSGQQNVYMNNSSNSWNYSLSMNAGSSLSYFYTFNVNNAQYDTPTYTWTHP
jgi:beta-glucanase (GH16 family)